MQFCQEEQKRTARQQMRAEGKTNKLDACTEFIKRLFSASLYSMLFNENFINYINFLTNVYSGKLE